MIRSEVPGSIEEFHAAVVHECESSVILGAYASQRSAHYLFADASRGIYELSHALGEDRCLRAVSGAVAALSWDEREMAQERGIRFESLPDARPLRDRFGVMPQAVVAHGEGLMHFVVGPVHAGIIEPGRFTISSGGETVVHLDAQLGYAHRGVELDLEGEDAREASRKIARICGACTVARSYAYALAVEELAGIEVDVETDLVRLILAELERIGNHLSDLAASASGGGWNPGLTRGLGLKERMMRLCDRAAGHRLLFDSIVPGGVRVRDLQMATELRALEQEVFAYLDALFGNASLVSRWHRAGVLSHAVARAGGAVGPAHRASRGKVDLRTVLPYGAYRVLAPKTARAHAGDAFSRCTVKRDEIVESFRLIGDALRALGRTAIPQPVAIPQISGRTVAAVEGPRGAEIVAVHADACGRLERVHVISASYRNWPLVARAMDGNIVPDFPLVNKSFNLCYACADR